ncbi:hypothetical protein [Streptomyces sannanensis]|uniref:hypothetical protein n=1 Tax=Streptomyces sannanensis TaxID=285536 RepID=UPI0031EE33D6
MTQLDNVVPGCLVVVVRDDQEGRQTYEIAEIPNSRAQRLSPGSSLAETLMWRRVAEPLEFIGPTGDSVSVRISRIIS